MQTPAENRSATKSANDIGPEALNKNLGTLAGESFLAVDAWETLSALDGKEEVPLELDGLSVARLFTDGPPIALQVRRCPQWSYN